ncbi:MAG: endopeptidase La [Alphaproteobacteria bacterium]|nr:MAG: endopeptidase La [Alphaproteobacteria bacterium]
MGAKIKLIDPRNGQAAGVDADDIVAILVDPVPARFLDDKGGTVTSDITQVFTNNNQMLISRQDPQTVIDAVKKGRSPGNHGPYLLHHEDIEQFMRGMEGTGRDAAPEPDPDSMAGLSQSVQSAANQKMNKQQQIYVLHQQRDAIDEKLKELGEDNGEDDNEKLARMVKDAVLPDDIRKDAEREMGRLKKMSPMAPEAGVARTWLELLVALPWGKYTDTNKDIGKAEDTLNRDHYGLEKVKERILDFLAVLNQPDATGQGKILCLVGPPGVGKTSIVKSIAEAADRKCERIALGGVKEEAEVRGHRRTFIGALPGNIIQAMKRAGTMNPVINLDEIDKMGAEVGRGDPASAFLEVLDPKQNHKFRDHYLDQEVDLSKVLFICTANEEDKIPLPLYDRMEIIRLPGYTREQKFEIGTRYLIPQQMKETGLKSDQFELAPDALRSIINDYTREAGVRNLERIIGTVCSKAVRKIQKEPGTKVSVTAADLKGMLGSAHTSGDKIPDEDSVGIVNGLAWSAVGGSTLQIEAVTTPGKDFRLNVTGNLKDVMKESANVAHTVTINLCEKFNIAAKLKECDIHVHALSGSIPKDGPSAGAAMTTAQFSAVSGIKIRRDVAMTGEISLNGKVMKIGGLPEKLDGALRDGCKTVLIPKDNLGDLEDVPAEILSKLKVIPVSTIEEVLDLALVRKPSMAITVGREPANGDCRTNAGTQLAVMKSNLTPA